MIVVRVELHSAITGKITELARMGIANIGGTREHGDYQVLVWRGRSRAALDKLTFLHQGEVHRHPRLREHVWHLVAKALRAVKYGEPR